MDDENGVKAQATSWFERFNYLHTGIYIAAFVLVIIGYIVVQSGMGMKRVISKVVKKWIRNSKRMVRNCCSWRKTTQVETAPVKQVEAGKQPEKEINDFKKEEF